MVLRREGVRGGDDWEHFLVYLVSIVREVECEMGSIGRPATKSSTRRTDPHTSAAPLNYDDREMSAFSETRIDADVDAFGNGGAEIVAYVIERPEYLSPTWTHVARVRPQTDANLAERSDYHFRVCVGNVEICQTDGCQIVFTADG